LEKDQQYKIEQKQHTSVQNHISPFPTQLNHLADGSIY